MENQVSVGLVIGIFMLALVGAIFLQTVPQLELTNLLTKWKVTLSDCKPPWPGGYWQQAY